MDKNPCLCSLVNTNHFHLEGNSIVTFSLLPNFHVLTQLLYLSPPISCFSLSPPPSLLPLSNSVTITQFTQLLFKWSFLIIPATCFKLAFGLTEELQKLCRAFPCVLHPACPDCNIVHNHCTIIKSRYDLIGTILLTKLQTLFFTDILFMFHNLIQDYT